jgi:hypothetical protein
MQRNLGMSRSSKEVQIAFVPPRTPKLDGRDLNEDGERGRMEIRQEFLGRLEGERNAATRGKRRDEGH